MYKFVINLIDTIALYLSRHPKLMLGLVVCTGMIALLTLLTQPQSAIVLYQAF
jgi:hypothetical protein